jgi:hypothetical protein
MKTKTIAIRINWEDYKKAKREVRPYPNESLANWFSRLIKKLERGSNKN